MSGESAESGLIIRAGSAADRENVADLARESIGWHADRWSDVMPAPESDAMRAAYAELPDNDDHYLAVAEHQDRIVGFLTGNVAQAPDGGIERHDGPVAFVSDVAVTADARRLGVATRLMEDFEQWARASGAATITLMMHAGNEPAYQLYRSLGFGDSWVRMRKDLTG